LYFKQAQVYHRVSIPGHDYKYNSVALGMILSQITVFLMSYAIFESSYVNCCSIVALKSLEGVFIQAVREGSLYGL